MFSLAVCIMWHACDKIWFMVWRLRNLCERWLETRSQMSTITKERLPVLFFPSFSRRFCYIYLFKLTGFSLFCFLCVWNFSAQCMHSAAKNSWHNLFMVCAYNIQTLQMLGNPKMKYILPVGFCCVLKSNPLMLTNDNYNNYVRQTLK